MIDAFEKTKAVNCWGDERVELIWGASTHTAGLKAWVGGALLLPSSLLAACPLLLRVRRSRPLV